MQLQDQQDLLARLYTDNTFRSDFLTTPSRFAKNVGISPEEATVLASVAAGEVEWFAESLVSKRLREVRKLLPMTGKVMGSNEFDRRFREFSGVFSPTGVKKHLEDSLAFSEALVNDESVADSQRGSVRFEASRLRHNAFNKRFSFCVLRIDPWRFAGIADNEIPWGIGIWIAFGGWSRIFFRADRKRADG